MRRLAIAIATMLIGSTTLAEDPSTQITAQPSPRYESVFDSHVDSVSHNTPNRSDVKFLKDFAQINAAEVETGTLAKWKAKDTEVKAFAIHMIETHAQTIGKVQAIAAQLNIDVKAKPAFMQKAKFIAVDMSVGASFDRAYVKAMVKDHEKVIEMLEEEIKNGQDPTVKQFAAEALADVQKHLKVAQDLHAKVFADPSESESLARNDSKKPEKLATNR